MTDEIAGSEQAGLPPKQAEVQPPGQHVAVEGTESPAEDGTEAEPISDPRTHRFECRSCGYVYDPAEGVKKVGITSGTAFEELDAISFRCPVCRSRVGAFRDIGPATKASGFEENLDYGLGVNRLTPGQKNVLIFGSLALGFAFSFPFIPCAEPRRTFHRAAPLTPTDAEIHEAPA